MKTSFQITKLNNKGLSLVELIVALAIGAIVAGSISALISFSLRMYHNESTNTSMQYELQTALDQIEDSVMQSSGMVIAQNGSVTGYAAFGKYTTNSDATVTFTGEIFYSEVQASGSYNIYMNRGTFSGSNELEAAKEGLYSITDSTDKKPYLLAEHCKFFKITPDPAGKCFFTDDGVNKYKNPLSVKIELEFEKTAYKTITRKAEDFATMRNKVTSTVYIDGDPYILEK